MAGRVGSPRGAGSAKRGSWTGVLGIQDADPERCQVEDGGGLESDGGWGGIPDGLGTIEDSECRRPPSREAAFIHAAFAEWRPGRYAVSSS